MVLERLTAVLQLDQSEFKSGIEESISDLDNFGAKSQTIASGAMMALGGSITAVMQNTQDMRADLAQTAVTMGITDTQAQELARSVSNATFPLEDAASTLGSLSEAGVESEERMAELATEFDTLADATGTSANALVEGLTPALRNLENGIDDVTEVQDTLTYLQHETTLSVDEFTHSVERLSPELAELGVNMNDTVAILAAMEENGITGRAALQELRQATNNTDGGMDDLIDTLDISEQQLREQHGAIQEAEGSTREYAEANNSTITTVDKLQNRFNELKIAAGGILAPVEAAGPALMGIGGAMMTASAASSALAAAKTMLSGTITGGLVPATVAGSGGLTGLAASAVTAQIALGPITAPIYAIVGALAALGAAAYGAYKIWSENIFGIRDTVSNALETVKGWLDQVPNWLLALTGPLGALYAAWDENLFGIQDIVSDVFSWIGDQIDWMIDLINRIPGVSVGDDGNVESEDPIKDRRGGGSNRRSGRQDRSDDRFGTTEDPFQGGTSPALSEAAGSKSGSGGTSIEDEIAASPALSVSSTASSNGSNNQKILEKLLEELRSIKATLESPQELEVTEGAVETDEGHIIEIVDGRLEREVRQSQV